MDDETRRKHRRPGKDPALTVVTVLLTAAACAAAVWLVLSAQPWKNCAAAGTLKCPAYVSGSSLTAPRSSSEAALSSAASSAQSAGSQTASSEASSSAAAAPITDFKSAVFIGDSITLGIKEYSAAECAGVFATNGMGITNALSTKVTVGTDKLSLVDALRKVRPKQVYIMLGSNDLTWITGSQVSINYGKLLETLKAAYPDAQYFGQSIMPVSAAYEKKTGVTNSKIDSLNIIIATNCRSRGVRYLDVGSALKGSDGKLLSDAAADGFNIKSAYYKKWLEKVLDLVKS
jgi:lysophospholipase L1-like esterase